MMMKKSCKLKDCLQTEDEKGAISSFYSWIRWMSEIKLKNFLHGSLAKKKMKIKKSLSCCCLWFIYKMVISSLSFRAFDHSNFSTKKTEKQCLISLGKPLTDFFKAFLFILIKPPSWKPLKVIQCVVVMP